MNVSTKQQKTFYEINLTVTTVGSCKILLKYSEKLRTIKQFSS